MIEVKNVSYSYGQDEEAIVDLSVQFPPGEISAVLGESGSGKTTLLMCMGRFQQPCRGSIELSGVDIFTIPEKDFRKKVGIVFQKLYLFPHKTVLENMIMAPVYVLEESKASSRREAKKMLDRLGIIDTADQYPSQISGGQAQRAAIGRALMLKPAYMLLDEPTSALDANTTDDFADWLIDLRGETNFIIVTHDILFAQKVASRGVYLSGGKVVDCDSIDNIVSHVRAGKLVEVVEAQ